MAVAGFRGTIHQDPTVCDKNGELVLLLCVSAGLNQWGWLTKAGECKFRLRSAEKPIFQSKIPGFIAKV